MNNQDFKRKFPPVLSHKHKREKNVNFSHQKNKIFTASLAVITDIVHAFTNENILKTNAESS